MFFLFLCVIFLVTLHNIGEWEALCMFLNSSMVLRMVIGSSFLKGNSDPWDPAIFYVLPVGPSNGNSM